MLYYKSTTLFACGKRGIRTLGTRKGTTVFETVPIDHSGIFPLIFGFSMCKSTQKNRIYTVLNVKKSK